MNETKEHILKVSFLLFLQKNFKEVTMKEIVEKTGLSKGAFYHYFKSKEKLFEEVVNQYYFSDLSTRYDNLDKSSLARFCDEYLNLVQNFSAWQMLSDSGDQKKLSLNYYILIFDAIKILPDFGQKMIKANQREFSAMKEAVVNARKSGEINSTMSDEQIAQIFLFITDGIGIRGILYGNVNSMVEDIKKFWSSFYATLKA
jgi:TetR/AcrR family transcriptional regulator, transcriptional repressor for nem operon